MFACRDATALMTAAEEGALSGLSLVKYRIHMSICFHCRACRRQLREAVALSREIPREDAPSHVVDAALAAFRERHRKS
jgi:hypothetical protein